MATFLWVEPVLRADKAYFCSMKVIVTHPGKQHVAALLEALEKRGWLVLFCSRFISNLLPVPPLGGKVEKFLRKRRYNPEAIPLARLRHQGLGFLANDFRGKISGQKKLYAEAFVHFDEWASQQLITVDYDICIGYENANLRTFTTAKQQGRVTVLDLAQVHQEAVVSMMTPVWSARQIEQEQEVANKYKDAALAVTDYVITLSTLARDSMLENGWSEDRVYLANLGINPFIFYPAPAGKAKSTKFTFLFVGSMMVRKGIDQLLSIWERISPQIDAKLVFVGPMADAKTLMDKSAADFEYHPFMHHEQLAGQYRSADVYLLPSLLDSWAQTVIEAMASGTAAIVSDQTGAKDAVTKGGGWVVKAGDENALETAMMYAYHNQKEVAEKGLKAAEIAREYTWVNYHQQIAAIMLDIAQKENISIHH